MEGRTERQKGRRMDRPYFIGPLRPIIIIIIIIIIIMIKTITIIIIIAIIILK